MHIDWHTLGEIAVVSGAAALTVVVLVACALVTSSGRVDAQHGGEVPGPRTAVATAVTTLCLVAAGLVVGYGLYLIVS